MRELEIEAAVSNTRQVLDFVNACVDEAGGGEKMKKKLSVLVDEVYSNIAKYAYAPATGPAVVQVSLEEDPPRVVVVFKDKGVPFNCLELSDPDTSLSVEDRPVGGLGIFMVKEIADEISYAWEEGCNILTVKKYLQ